MVHFSLVGSCIRAMGGDKFIKDLDKGLMKEYLACYHNSKHVLYSDPKRAQNNKEFQSEIQKLRDEFNLRREQSTTEKKNLELKNKAQQAELDKLRQRLACAESLGKVEKAPRNQM